MYLTISISLHIQSNSFFFLFSFPLPLSLFSFFDFLLEHHRLTRRFLSPAFSIKYIQELAPLMLSVYDRFKDKILKLSKEKGDSDGWVKIDIWKETHAISLDIIGEVSFKRKRNI